MQINIGVRGSIDDRIQVTGRQETNKFNCLEVITE